MTALSLNLKAGRMFFSDNLSLRLQLTNRSGSRQWHDDSFVKEATPLSARISSTPCEKQLKDFYLEQDKLSGMKMLNNMFPNFPDSMLQVLILREDGNINNIAKSLMEKGWKPKSKHLKSLRKNPCPLLQIPYYWGTWKTEYIQKLKRKPNGTYITCVVKTKPMICYIENKKLIMQQVSYPLVDSESILELNLSYPLSRPASVSLLDLIPRITKPVIVTAKNNSIIHNL